MDFDDRDKPLAFHCKKPLISYEFSITEAQKFEARGILHEWLQSFLRESSSPNIKLADALLKDGVEIEGLRQLELNQLTRLAGPEPGAFYKKDSLIWNAEIEFLKCAIQNGAELPPLVVRRSSTNLYIEDGNHRHDALTRLGELTAVSVVFVSKNWFKMDGL